MAPADLTQVPATDPLRLYRCRDGLYAVDLLIAAVVHLKFFSWLAEHPSGMRAICAHFEIHERPADVMVTLFRANGLVESRGVLDIGGGSGIYSCSIAAHHPHVTATVFDQLPVTDIAERLIHERGCSQRVRTRVGDMWTDPWPTDCDVHLFSNVLHDWDSPEVSTLLARSYAALQPGGLLVIHEAFIEADKSGPLPVAEYSALLMYATQGKYYSTAEYEDLLGAAGFESFAFTPTVADRGVMTARRPASGTR